MQDVFGVMGFPMTHSWSQKYFTNKFETEKINAIFKTFAVENIGTFQQDVLNANKNLKGFCITIPHKKNIIQLLYHTSEAVQQIGACNCVRIINEKLYGYNTDVIGFEKSFVPHLRSSHKKALVLGTGGAAAAVVYVLKKMGIAFRCVSRQKNDNQFMYEDIDADVLAAYTIIINCTPAGMYPNIDVAPNLPYSLLTPKHYLYDLIYNPTTTLFLQKGKQQGATVKNGYEMLVLQAEENWKIWNDGLCVKFTNPFFEKLCSKIT